MRLSNNAAIRKNVVASLVGNVLEWYDFAIYGFLAPILGRRFFPADEQVALVAAAMIAWTEVHAPISPAGSFSHPAKPTQRSVDFSPHGQTPVGPARSLSSFPCGKHFSGNPSHTEANRKRQWRQYEPIALKQVSHFEAFFQTARQFDCHMLQFHRVDIHTL